MFLWNIQSHIWKPIDGCGENGNIFRYKLERSFLRNCLVFCSFISQSYSFPFHKTFAKTVPVEFAKWYLKAHRGVWWKRKYLQLKTEKKLSEKLPCVLLIIHLTELQLSPQEAFAKNVLVGYSKSYLEAHRGLWWKRKYLPLKSGKKLSEKLLCVLLIHLRELQLPLKKLFTKTFHVEFAKLYLEALTGLWWKRKYSKVKTE